MFVINSLAAGGAERALTDLLAYLQDDLRQYTVHLVLLDVEEQRHAVPPYVRKHILDAKFGMLSSIVLLGRLLRELTPAVTLSFLNRANCANVVSSKILGYPCIISERVHTTSHFGTGVGAAINKAIVRLTYRLADQVIAVSEGVKDELITNFGVRETKVRVIYNPINIGRICERASEAPSITLPKPYILGMGRLVPNKNFRLLIESYWSSGISENLVILGEGSERSDLEMLVSKLGLRERVLLPGYVQNPYPVLRGARLFVSSSNAEGFPNALIEAMALGCPVVATDCNAGPMEILTQKMAPRPSEVTLAEYGILVPVSSAKLLTDAIRIASREDIRDQYSQRGKQRARDFGIRSSVDQYRSAIASYASV
ncbi:glycosyltransferase [Bradyrhizobium australiense]|uniref:Glycosyltransferase n=1 Tax=Bradyrhizobium australiense TaxID=2721161 RepID=A0A7Y4LUD1_9BRAD|nr:glycosyltransferase [Bradyrhizobium australiense]NOJ39133.1 glycosyltransferase [Bradyrhizobium australiense]